MMDTLIKKSVRNLNEIKWRGVFIVLIVAGGVGIYSGGFMSRDTILNTRDTYYKDLNLADLEVNFVPAAEEELPDLGHLKDKYTVSKRLVMPATMEKKDGQLLSSLVVYLDPDSMPPVNMLRIIEGEYLSADEKNGIVIERTLAEVHGYKVNDKIVLNPYSFPEELIIRGIAVSPEFIIATSDPTVLIPSRGSLGIIFASRRLIEEFFGYPMYNDILFDSISPRDTQQIKGDVLSALSSLDIERVTTKEGQFAYRFLKEDMKGFSIFIPAILSVFGIVTAVIILITLNRLIMSQSREIGVLMALGYRRRSIFFSYFLTGLFLGMLGCLLAIPASILIRDLFSNTYAEVVGLPPLYPVISPYFILTGFALGITITSVATVIPLIRVLRLMPQEALRGEKEELFLGLPSWLNKIITVLSLGSSSRRLGMRNIFRRPRLSFATVLMIAFSISISTSFLISASTWENFADVTFSREKWDAIVAFKAHLGEDEFKKIINTEGVKDYGAMVAGYGSINIMDRAYDYTLIGINPVDSMRSFHIIEGDELSSPEGLEILINRAWADLPELHAGDIIKVETRDGSFDFKVAGIISDMSLGIAFIPIVTARRILKLENKFSAFFATFNTPDHKTAKDNLMTHEMVARVELKRDMENLVGTYLEEMKRLTYISLFISIFIGILFLLSSTTMNILEREGEYATLDTMGYKHTEIAGSVITEIVTEGIIAVLLSIPVSILLSAYLNVKMSEAWLPVEMPLTPKDFLVVMTGTLLALPAAAIPGLIHIFRLDIAVAVRRRSFG